MNVCRSDYLYLHPRSINTNYVGLVSLLNIIASHFIDHRTKGFIIGISSVAGERGRSSNFIYGSSKAAFTTYLSGLRNNMNKTNVKIITVKPGFIDTKMTKNIKFNNFLRASPNIVAKDVFIDELNMKIKEDPIVQKTVPESNSLLKCNSTIYKHECPFGTLLKKNSHMILGATNEKCCELDWEILNIIIPAFLIGLLFIIIVYKKTIGGIIK